MVAQTVYYKGNTGAGGKTRTLASLIAARSAGMRIADVLVVGCGDGSDARALGRHFGCRVEAIDLEHYYDNRNDDYVRFTQMDACGLAFEPARFDFIYSFHALEHIPDYRRAVAEIGRVLKDGGAYCIGTPNRSRLAGYVGIPGYPMAQKIQANLRDWSARLRGRFRNEFGAHAGFTSRELLDICNAIGPGRDISTEYYFRLYGHRKGVLRAITTLNLQSIVWPSVYILGRKAGASTTP
ncbi:MAG TPA: class I SAM-dependent methyltransferase [Candidatus Udaeobacter sp.]|nr:class I SAM-dependent methyltransferase [Candidatus Udaeobacter sp.]